MNVNEFAKKINNREYGEEITNEECKEAKELGFVVVFGYSDDNVEFRGAIDDEKGCINKKVLYLTSTGLLEPCECECTHYLLAKKNSKTITALWNRNPDFIWTFETDIPHATFDIFEEGTGFCRGIVFDIKSLKD